MLKTKAILDTLLKERCVQVLDTASYKSYKYSLVPNTKNIITNLNQNGEEMCHFYIKEK